MRAVSATKNEFHSSRVIWLRDWTSAIGLLLAAAVFWWMVYDGWKTGEVSFRSISANRDKNPGGYLSLLMVLAFVGFLAAVGGLYTLIF